MDIIERQSGDIVILDLSGRLDTTNYQQFEAKTMGLLNEGKNKIVINCSKLDYISSSGLRIMLMALKGVGGGMFTLCELQENIREIFEISGFSSIFKIFATEQDAVDNKK